MEVGGRADRHCTWGFTETVYTAEMVPEVTRELHSWQSLGGQASPLGLDLLSLPKGFRPMITTEGSE